MYRVYFWLIWYYLYWKNSAFLWKIKSFLSDPKLLNGCVNNKVRSNKSLWLVLYPGQEQRPPLWKSVCLTQQSNSAFYLRGLSIALYTMSVALTSDAMQIPRESRVSIFCSYATEQASVIEELGVRAGWYRHLTAETHTLHDSQV